VSKDDQGYTGPQGRFKRKFRTTRRHIYSCADCLFRIGDGDTSNCFCDRYSKAIPARMILETSQPKKPEWCAVIDIVINEDRYILDRVKPVCVIERKSG